MKLETKTPDFLAVPEDISNSPQPILWYTTSATDNKIDDVIQRGLPIGNGRLGALVGGDPQKDFFYIAEGTMWLGGRNDSLTPDGSFPYDESDTFGNFVMLAKVYIELPDHDMSKVKHYRRALDLTRACMGVEYEFGDATYERAVCASHQDDVIAVHLKIKQGHGSYTGTVQLQGIQGETVSTDPTAVSLYFKGELPYGTSYAARVCAKASGGALSITDGKISFIDCSELVFIFSGGTNYKYRPDTSDPYNFIDTSIDPLSVATHKGDSARKEAIEDLFTNHVMDYQKLFNTMQVNLGASSDDQRKMDTETRLNARGNLYGVPDPELEATYLQFGRYLTIAGSRGALPTNLQGIWLNANDPSWHSDYHTDINIEMNYWLPDRAGLESCFEPLKNYCLSQLASWTDITKRLFEDLKNPYKNTNGKPARGWTIAYSVNPYGGNGWYWHPTANAWLCNNLWQHYAYTQNKQYLHQIYPLLKGACDFWKNRLVSLNITDPDTGRIQQYLVNDQDWSPEQGDWLDTSQGITYSQELIWDLFTHYLEASDILEGDADDADEIRGLLSQLYLPRTNPDTGCLQEWQLPCYLGEANHRHLSPLVGFFPGDRICPDTNPPELIAAVTHLLTSRGLFIPYGWANAWRAMCWAKLKQSITVYNLIIYNITNQSFPNFFNPGGSSQMQIDSNYGTPTAMLEAILSSRWRAGQPARIELLPALPGPWSASGKVTGIGACGGFSVDITWSHGQPAETIVKSVNRDLKLSADIIFGKTTRRIHLDAHHSEIRLIGPQLRPVEN